MKEAWRSAANNMDCDISHSVSGSFPVRDFHAHDRYEIFYFLEGSLQYYIEEQSFLLSPGDILVIPPGLLHRPVFMNDAAIYERMVLMVHPVHAQRLLRSVPDSFVHRQTPPRHIVMQEESERADFRRAMDQMLAAQDDAAGFLLRDTCLTQVLLMLDKAMQSDAVQSPGTLASVQQIIVYLNANFTKPLTLDEIAEKFHLSKYHLLRQFKAYTNATVHSYLLTKRIVLAKALLKEGYRPQEVCFSCGFGSYGSFYQAFLQQEGVSPAEYLRRSRERFAES